jgi:hypothetical protein
MFLNSLILSALIVVVFGGIWLVFHTPSCRACRVRLEAIGESISPRGRLGIDVVFYYFCPQCAWMTRRRHTIIHLE